MSNTVFVPRDEFEETPPEMEEDDEDFDNDDVLSLIDHMNISKRRSILDRDEDELFDDEEEDTFVDDEELDF